MKYKKMWYKLMKEIKDGARYGTASETPGMSKAMDKMIEIECQAMLEPQNHDGGDGIA